MLPQVSTPLRPSSAAQRAGASAQGALPQRLTLPSPGQLGQCSAGPHSLPSMLSEVSPPLVASRCRTAGVAKEALESARFTPSPGESFGRPLVSSAPASGLPVRCSRCTPR